MIYCCIRCTKSWYSLVNYYHQFAPLLEFNYFRWHFEPELDLPTVATIISLCITYSSHGKLTIPQTLLSLQCFLLMLVPLLGIIHQLFLPDRFYLVFKIHTKCHFLWKAFLPFTALQAKRPSYFNFCNIVCIHTHTHIQRGWHVTQLFI